MPSKTRLSSKIVPLVIVLLATLIGCDPPDPPFLTTERPGLATEDEALLIALPLVNKGDVSAGDVRVSVITLESQRIMRPEASPLSVGDLPARGTTVLQLAFESQGLEVDQQYLLRLEGTASVAGVARRFRLEREVSLPPPDQGEGTVRRVTVEARQVDGGGFEPGSPEVDLEGINDYPGPPIPEGLRDATSEPRNRPVGIEGLVGGGGESQTRDLNEPITFVRTGGQTIVQPCCVLEPSGGSVDQVPGFGPSFRTVFLSGNTYLLLSTDGGATYTRIDPFTVFPTIPLDGLPQDEGFCCDQNLLYIPSINRFVWQLLTRGSQVGMDPITGNPINGMNRLRVAAASPQQVIASSGTAWSYWDLTTATFGFTSTSFLDYPDLSFSEDYLRISATALNPLQPGQAGDGFFVAAVPLADIKNGGGIGIGYTDPKDGRNSYSARLAHDCPDGAYWFGHASNNTMRIFSWRDGASKYYWDKAWVGPWTSTTSPFQASITPGGINWLRANTDAVRGATCRHQGAALPELVDPDLLVAWNAGRGGSFPQPHVRLARFVKTGILWTNSPGSEIWNPDFAFHHAHLATNANGEVGISVAAGGGTGGHPTPVTGFVGDAKLIRAGVSTASIDRWGDYTAIRPHWPNDKLFSVSDYFLLAPSASMGQMTGVHQYRLFGRTADVGATF